MNCHLAHQRKDNSHDEVSEDHDATRGGGYCRGGRPVLERKLHPEHKFRSCYGGSGYHRQAPDAGELRWCGEADGQAVRSRRILLLEVAMCSNVLGLWAKSSLDICHKHLVAKWQDAQPRAPL